MVSFMNSMFSLLLLDIHESMCLFILLEKQKMILFDVCLKHLEDWAAWLKYSRQTIWQLLYLLEMEIVKSIVVSSLSSMILV